jgi:hypothetical protein
MKTLTSVSGVLPSGHEVLKPDRSSAVEGGLVRRIKTFFGGFTACTEACSRSSKDFLNSSVGNISSLSTPNGPWVYTVVPWED